MADWDEEQAADEARSNYEQRVKRAGVNLLNAAQAFQNDFDAIRASATAENQTLMDTKHTQLVNGLKTALGIT